MFFLLRTAFWLSLLLLVLPIGGGKSDGPSANDRASIDAMSALAAAGATVSDVSGFCQRQPDACKVGSQALQLVTERAKTGAEMLQDYFAETKGADAKVAGAKGAAAATTVGARDTLTASDRKPAWRSPSGRSA